MAKPILISISPNTDAVDVWQAVKILFQPWQWQQGKAQLELKRKLKNYFKLDHCFLVNSGRTGLYLALKSLNLKLPDEVLCQAFTCVAVPNAINWANAKPVFVDIVKNSFNLDIEDLTKKITKNSKALIIQHTFGQPDDIKAIKKICQKHNLVLIEDCAHSLGARYQGKPVGSFGDLTVLSFGRDKVISSVFGGALLVSNSKFLASINQLINRLDYPAASWTLKQLFHPIFFSVIVPTYFSFRLGKFSLGKGLLFLLQKLNLVTLPVSASEKICQSSLAAKKLPNALAVLALHQFNKLALINQKRRSIALIYHQQLQARLFKPGSIYLRFPLLVKKPEILIKKLAKKNVLLGDWYRPVIAPKGVDFKKVGYRPGSCPNAEAASQQIVNLPTHPKMPLQDAEKIVKLIKDYLYCL
jgi:dTDP-4-amino-4,6-dideoxygalactose transaminase